MQVQKIERDTACQSTATKKPVPITRTQIKQCPKRPKSAHQVDGLEDEAVPDAETHVGGSDAAPLVVHVKPMPQILNIVCLVS
jgi:hypothetical protein